MKKDEITQVDNTINLITIKLKQVQIKNLHPPYFPKHLTKYREEYYLSLKNTLKLYFEQKGN